MMWNRLCLDESELAWVEATSWQATQLTRYPQLSASQQDFSGRFGEAISPDGSETRPVAASDPLLELANPRKPRMPSSGQGQTKQAFQFEPIVATSFLGQIDPDGTPSSLEEVRDV